MWNQRSKEWDQGSEGWDLGSQAMGLGLTEQGSGCTIFVGSGTKIYHAFGIDDQKFWYKNGMSDKKHTSLQPWYMFNVPHNVTATISLFMTSPHPATP